MVRYQKIHQGFGSETNMFKSTCSMCGKPCEVPFKPINGRPVFCKVCFKIKNERKKKEEVDTT